MSEVRTYRYPRYHIRLPMVGIGAFYASLVASSLAIASAVREGRFVGDAVSPPLVAAVVMWYVYVIIGCSRHRWSRVRVSDEGIAALSRFGKIELSWGDIKKVEVYPKPWGTPLYLRFQTSKGDFTVLVGRLGELLEQVALKLPGRVSKAKRRHTRWEASNLDLVWTCSKCGGRFGAITCTFCEKPVVGSEGGHG